MAYQRDDIERVRAATNLVELVGEVTKVKRSGRNSMAVCPFHQEKTASLSVDGARGLYHCFGCGESGDVFRFVEQTHSLNFVEALELLAKRAGIALRLDPKAKERRGEREPLIEAVEAAVEFYHVRLRKAEDGAGARRYLRGRGYDTDVVDQFQLGYSPAEPGALTKHLRRQGVTDGVMIKAGLSSRGRGGELYDRFRGRIMFPIYDLRGDVVGFGARLLEGEGPKYLNSPETPIYHKSRLLYGLNWSKSAIVRRKAALVVEGYTDVIALHQADLPIAVATCGTALGESHLDLLRRFTDTVVLAFDADEAGAGAALRGGEMSIPADVELRVAVLPEGRDPADLVEAGLEAKLGEAVDASVPLLQFRIERELSKYRLDEPEARSRAVRAAVRLIAAHPDPVTRHEYAVFVSRHTGVDLDVVLEAAGGRARPTPVSDGKAQPTKLTGREKAEQQYLRLLLANDADARRLAPGPQLFTVPLHVAALAQLSTILRDLNPGETPQLGGAIGEDEVGRYLNTLALDTEPLPEAKVLVRRLQAWAIEDRLTTARLGLDELDPGSEEFHHRMGVIQELEADLRALAAD
jgi:DNA primase